ncbi:MAG: hypothetical protein ACFCUV_03930 [Rivularia sp. (in: cyanobacteria)]
MNKALLFSVVDKTKMFSRNFYLIAAVVAIVLVVAIVIFFPIAQAHTKWIEEAAISFEENKRYSTIFAINGNTLVTRTYQHPNNYQSSDSKRPYKPDRTYIYTYNGKNWLQQAELTIPEEKQSGEYGYIISESTAIDGDTILLGANVFIRSGDSWSFSAKLQPPSFENLGMGKATVLDGDTAVIGSEYATHVFRRNPDTGNWLFETEIRRPFPQGKQLPGGEVAIDGDTLVDGNRVYRRSSTNDWLLEAELTLNGKPIEKISQVDISGNTIVVGMKTEFTIDDDSRGTAYVFERNPYTGVWKYKTKLIPHDMLTFAIYGFGSRIAIDGSIIIAGHGFRIFNQLAYSLSWFLPKPKGRAYIFVRNQKGRWLHSATLKPNNKEKATGGDVTISGNRVVVRGKDDNKLYIYKRVD